VSETQVDPAFEELLEFLRETRGFDYAAYKRPSLIRRFARRMHAAGVESYEDYRHYLEADSREFAELFDSILINVTSFFRDQSAWTYLAENVVPTLVGRKPAGDRIRVWSAGCASGEEAYTAAIILAEQLGEERFREQVKIYATDLDEEELNKARQAVYRVQDVEPVPEALRTRYFQEANGGLVVRGDVRRSVIFGRNDLLSDAPISRVDLLISRNTLMYFGSQAQQRILSNFFFALNQEGFLFLGKAEALQSRTNLFEPLELKHRVFVKKHRVEPESRSGLPRHVAEAVSPRAHPLQETAFDQGPHAQLIVDAEGSILLVNHQARTLFGLSQKDVGRPLRDLEVSHRPIELQSRIDQAFGERRPISVRDAVWAGRDGDDRHFDVQVAPLVSPGGEAIGVSIAFSDISRSRALREELERAKRDLETAYEELQSTVEELETTNEELQSTNEELETTNEELQSTNEELETMNEELQSTNEELETMNDEMRERTDEALRANAFLGSILSSVHQSVVVLDPELKVRAWSDAAAELWGLRATEVEGEFFLNLDIGLAVGELRAPIRATLAGNEADDVALAAHNRRGHPIACEVSFAPLAGARGRVEGVVMVMTALPQAEPNA
jgi:two-component system CheB/CheR fusion protein